MSFPFVAQPSPSNKTDAAFCNVLLNYLHDRYFFLFRLSCVLSTTALNAFNASAMMVSSTVIGPAQLAEEPTRGTQTYCRWRRQASVRCGGSALSSINSEMLLWISGLKNDCILFIKITITRCSWFSISVLVCRWIWMIAGELRWAEPVVIACTGDGSLDGSECRVPLWSCSRRMWKHQVYSSVFCHGASGFTPVSVLAPVVVFTAANTGKWLRAKQHHGVVTLCTRGLWYPPSAVVNFVASSQVDLFSK